MSTYQEQRNKRAFDIAQQAWDNMEPPDRTLEDKDDEAEEEDCDSDEADDE